MIVFPNCKINLGLLIKEKRPDGYHNIETVFYPIPLKDALEILPVKSNLPFLKQSSSSINDGNGIQFYSDGLKIDGNAADNLCVKAWRLLKQDYPSLPAVSIYLQKAIPMGAGLGGGSADGAFALMALNEKYQLRISSADLLHYALQLGSDCPFFILNQPSVARGRGELLSPVAIDLAGYQLIIINPGIHVNTGWAFGQWAYMNKAPDDTLSPKNLEAIVQQPPHIWKDALVNDFEPIVFAHHPEIQTIKETLYQNGAIYAAMSGSGSSVFGLFDKEIEDVLFKLPPQYLFKKVLL